MSYFNLSRFLRGAVVMGLLALNLTSSALAAHKPKYADLDRRFVKWHVNYYVNDDDSSEKVSEIAIKALQESAVEDLKKYEFSYSTSIEKSKVLEAYTLKADGKRINVPKDNFQVNVNKGNRDGGPVFSDRTRVTVVFPDFELNDTAVLKLKTTELKPMFPGNFSAMDYYYHETAYDDVKVTLNLPQKLHFKLQVRGMIKHVDIDDGRKVITLTYSNPKPLKDDRRDFSVWDWQNESGFAISTFKSYKDIAEAYGKRALPKAVPTKRVKALARKIVGNEKRPKQQARLIYNWVAKEISYAGNCIGVGAVVPHDTDFILDNRMGDCKDHATLLQALLTSVGIESIQALINAGSSYQLPKVPMVSSVNHVINYLPQWNQFVDSTNADMPFDLLGFSVSDKPVLLVQHYRKGMRTPPTRPGDTSQEITSVVNVQPDGSAKGSISVKVKGTPAAVTRAQWRNITDQQEHDWLKQMFSSQTQLGSGTVKKEDPSPLLSHFNFSYTFDHPDFIPSEGSGGFYISPMAYTPFSIAGILRVPNENIHARKTVCGNGSSRESIEYHFPTNIHILAKPNNFSISENYLSYRATYQLHNNVLKVTRELDDSTPGNVCEARLINAQRQTAIKISKNLRSQVVFQYQ